MFSGRILQADAVRVAVVDGFPDAIDALARRAAGGRCFLRAAWFRAAAGACGGRTILATRADGSLVAAIPTVELGPSIVGARTVPGSYWPFRSVLIAEDAHPCELAQLFDDSRARSLLTPMWRVGPVYRDDPALDPLERAAAEAGWTVLTRPLGTGWLLDLAAMIAGEGWPRKSTRQRLAKYERQLGQSGEVRFRTVTGAEWSDAVFADLAAIESNSWVGKTTDGSGAKFLNPGQRALWRSATRDPEIARALSATILHVGETPVAFSFDLRSGDLQYGIASSFDERFAAARPGKIVTWRQLGWAADEGVRTVDLGAGDSGYKREMGATAGPEIVDLLIVRSRSMARLISLKWGEESPLGRDVFRATARKRPDLGRFLEPVIAAGVLAATLAVVE